LEAGEADQSRGTTIFSHEICFTAGGLTDAFAAVLKLPARPTSALASVNRSTSAIFGIDF
jgi:hypothetical protein